MQFVGTTDEINASQTPDGRRGHSSPYYQIEAANPGPTSAIEAEDRLGAVILQGF